MFVFKEETAYELRISDWSADVCSSDLHGYRGRYRGRLLAFGGPFKRHRGSTASSKGGIRNGKTVVKLPARNIPVPRSVSEAAQAALSALADQPREPFPSLDDVAGWKRHIANGDHAMLALFAPMAARVEHVIATECRLGEGHAYCLVPQPRGDDKNGQASGREKGCHEVWRPGGA